MVLRRIWNACAGVYADFTATLLGPPQECTLDQTVNPIKVVSYPFSISFLLHITRQKTIRDSFIAEIRVCRPNLFLYHGR